MLLDDYSQISFVSDLLILLTRKTTDSVLKGIIQDSGEELIALYTGADTSSLNCSVQ